VSALHTR